jgi:hypothetical protein
MFTGPWVVSKRDGTDVGLEEAKSLLRPSGEIASADYITQEIQTLLHLAGRSVLVKFKEFKPDRSLHRVSILRAFLIITANKSVGFQRHRLQDLQIRTREAHGRPRGH